MNKMMRKSSFWGALFGGQKRYSFDDLHGLYHVLVRNPVVTESNKALIIETYRSIAEFMIWGDQNEPRVFEFFLENNVMVYLHRVLLQPANRRGDVAKQVLQTLSIIIQNVKSETGIFFLFSNNHINNIVELEFDFDDEEVLGYYVSFLKAISLKLNSGTVQFFLDERDGTMVFPLYTEGIKFAHHKEGMVRAGVRTLTLNVYSVEDHDVQMYVTTSTAGTYFAEMSNYIVDQVQNLDRRFQLAQTGTNPNALAALDSQLAEVEDMISYVSDIFSVGSAPVAELVSEQLWSALAGPLMYWPLLAHQPPSSSGAAAAAEPGSNSTPRHEGQAADPTASRTTSNVDAQSRLSRQTSKAEGTGSRTSVWCSLYLLERLFHIITYPPLLHHMLFALLSCPKVPRCSPSDPNRPSPKKLQFDEPTTAPSTEPTLTPQQSGLVAMSSLTMSKDSCENLSALNTPHSHSDGCESDSSSTRGQAVQDGADNTSSGDKWYCRDVLLGIITSGDIKLVSATLRLLVALLQNKAVAAEPLYLLGLLPPHKMMQLAGSNPEATHHRLYAWYRQLLRIQQSFGACYAYTAEVPASVDDPAATPSSTGQSMYIMPYDHALSALSLQAGLFPGPGHNARMFGRRYPEFGHPSGSSHHAAHTRHASMDSTVFPEASVSGSQFGTPDSTPVASNAPSVVDDDGNAVTNAQGMQLDLSAALPLSQGPVSSRKAKVASKLNQSSWDPDPPPTTGGRSGLDTVGGSGTDRQDRVNGHGGACASGASEQSTRENESVSARGGDGRELPSENVTGPGVADPGEPVASASPSVPGRPPLPPETQKELSSSPAAAGKMTGLPGPLDVAQIVDASPEPSPKRPQPSGGDDALGPVDATGGAVTAGKASTGAVVDAGSVCKTLAGLRGSDGGMGSAVGSDFRSRSASQQLLGEEGESESPQSSPIMQELLHPKRWPQEEQVLDALMQMLLLQTLPASGMWHASWLLYHLVPCEDGRSKWTEQQSSMFKQALGVARDQVLDELSGMWCEALFPLMYMEWPISREAILRPVLRASSDALLSGPYAYPLCQYADPGAAPFHLSLSATAALTAYHTVLRLIALLQMQQLFQHGTIAKSSPTPAVTDADLRQHDIQEGAHVDLHPGAAIPCIVSFAPGQERRVYFAIAGVSMQRLSTVSKDLEQVGGQTVLHSLPVVILADASASKLHSGVVLSVAPLLGSDPTTDKNMNRWLHVHVRPPVRGLLRMLKSASSKKGGLLTAMRQLADGHWVLAFPDPDRALNAKMIAQQHAAKLRALYCDVLTPVITTSDQDDSDSLLIPAGR